MAIVMGIVLIIAGVCALVAPVVAGAVTVVMVGSLMGVAGIVQCLHALRVPKSSSRMIWLLAGLITFLCGTLVAIHPILGLSFLTILLTVYFFADGFMKIGAAFQLVAHRGWFIMNGLMSLLLAYLIWSSWPLSGGWAVGVLVGVNLIFTGIMALAVGNELK